ncbi:hypothetical protein [Streptomyces minutiscleroticus]|uniref:hypothetical protein n=1 Tax=Streptomyces minutiscleroticus TaxID=68238 RepID=UPI003323C842
MLSTPKGILFARTAVLAASKWRETRQTRAAGPGGRAHHGGDGRTYDPRGGWSHTPPARGDGICAAG